MGKKAFPLIVGLLAVFLCKAPAYAAYSPGNYQSSIAYDLQNNTYLVVYMKVNDAHNADIYGRFIDDKGRPIGSDIVISDAVGFQSRPSVAYDSVNQKFLVVWEDRRNSAITSGDIYGQLVNGDGTLYGLTSDVNFVISNAAGYQFSPTVAYDSVNQRFLVVWGDNRNSAITSGDIYGQLVNADGTLYNTPSNVNFTICDQEDNQYDSSVAYDSVNQRFLVVWGDRRNYAITSSDIYGQLVKPDGTIQYTSSGNFVVYKAAGEQSEPSLAYNSNETNFLAAFTNRETGIPQDIAFVLIGSKPMPWIPLLLFED